MAEAEKDKDKPLPFAEDEEKQEAEPVTVDLGEGESTEQPAEHAPVADEAAAELKRQFDYERSQRVAAERAAQGERDARIMAERSATATGVALIDTHIEQAKATSSQAQSAFENALSSGNFKAAAEAQVALADARASLLRLQEQKAYYETEARQMENRQRQAPTREPEADIPSQDRIAHELDRTGFPKSAQWIRSHPEMVSDQKAINKVDGAHGYVVNVLGLVPETKEYFDKLEETLGMRTTPAATTPASRPVRQAPPPAAPVSPSVPNIGDGRVRRTSITLTKEQVEHARDVLGMTPKEYAEALLDAQDNPNYVARGGARR